jgi:hypothetical protein
MMDTNYAKLIHKLYSMRTLISLQEINLQAPVEQLKHTEVTWKVQPPITGAMVWASGGMDARWVKKLMTVTALDGDLVELAMSGLPDTNSTDTQREDTKFVIFQKIL